MDTVILANEMTLLANVKHATAHGQTRLHDQLV